MHASVFAIQICPPESRLRESYTRISAQRQQNQYSADRRGPSVIPRVYPISFHLTTPRVLAWKFLIMQISGSIAPGDRARFFAETSAANRRQPEAASWCRFGDNSAVIRRFFVCQVKAPGRKRDDRRYRATTQLWMHGEQRVSAQGNGRLSPSLRSSNGPAHDTLSSGIE